MISIPFAAQIQLDLQDLVPGATVAVEEDGEQDFKSFMEYSYGIEDDREWPWCK
jgi:hypothetical protein